MSDNYLGQIIQFGGNFAPAHWALCAGQLMSIQQNTALFSLCGTTFGGDGVQTFGLPDLRGRLPVGQGQLLGGSYYTMGETAGTEQVTVFTTQMPQHNHSYNATTTPGAQPGVANNLLTGSVSGTGIHAYVVPGTSPVTQDAMNGAAIGLAGGNQPHDNIMPSLVVTYIIALTGVYPSRN